MDARQEWMIREIRAVAEPAYESFDSKHEHGCRVGGEAVLDAIVEAIETGEIDFEEGCPYKEAQVKLTGNYDDLVKHHQMICERLRKAEDECAQLKEKLARLEVPTTI